MMKKAPKAYAIKDRPNLWAAKGIDPVTRARKNYFGNSPSEASAKALASFGFQDDYSLFRFYSNVYLPTVRHRSKNWLEQIAWAMDKHILPSLGEIDVRTVKRAQLQVVFNQLGRKMKGTSLSKIKIVLSGIFRLAVDDELIWSNPVTRVRLPRPEPVKKLSLSYEELRKLIDAAGPLAKPFIILAAGAGLRLGEAVGVTRGAIDKNGVLKVFQQVQQYKGGCVISLSLKTAHSYREIPLSKDMVTTLLDCQQVSDIWVCSDTKGGYVLPKNIRRELRLACTKAKVPMISPHELRHTFISLLDNELEAPRTVTMALAGHSAQSITDGYSHVKIEQKLKWVEKHWNRMSTACSPEKWATEPEHTGSIEPKKMAGTRLSTWLEQQGSVHMKSETVLQCETLYFGI